jgi:hypothetical protein
VLLAQRLLVIRDYGLEEEVLFPSSRSSIALFLSRRKRFSLLTRVEPYGPGERCTDTPLPAPPSHPQMQNVSTLKLRFGEAALQGCDVMIKDLQDSQKLDEAVHRKLPVRLRFNFPRLFAPFSAADELMKRIEYVTGRTAPCDDRQSAVLAELPGCAIEASGADWAVRLLLSLPPSLSLSISVFPTTPPTLHTSHCSPLTYQPSPLSNPTRNSVSYPS